MTYVRLNSKPVKENFNSLMENFFTPYPSIAGNDFNALHPSSQVPVNISKTAGGYEIEIVAAGFAKEDFTISLEKDLLTVSGDVKKSEEEKEVTKIRKEYVAASFKRSFTVDQKVDKDSISAQYEGGILTVKLALKPEEKPLVKQITID